MCSIKIVCGFMFAGFTAFAAGTRHTFSTPGAVVSEAITDRDDTVEIDCGSGSFVTLSGANTYTGGTKIVSGGVIVASPSALGTGPIDCAPGTAVRVIVSYRETEETLNTAIIDKIRVGETGDETEPWVSFQVLDSGLTNDVDFTEQPYLWLGSTIGTARILTGLFTPNGTTYKFGYTGQESGEQQGLLVTNLTDAVDGTPRSVLCRGKSTTTLDVRSGGNYSWTGGTVIEDGAFVSVNSSNDFGQIPDTVKTNHVVIRKGRINFKNPRMIYDARIGFFIDGEGVFHSCGASASVLTTFRGPLCGWGILKLSDQGGVAFHSPSNTYTGEIYDNNYHGTYFVDIVIGSETDFSWCGSRITQHGLKNHRVVFNCASDARLDTILSTAGGTVVKQGNGTLTLTAPFMRAAPADGATVSILNGTLRLPSLPAASGIAEFANNAVLDLAGASDASVWLPRGYGRIVNVSGSLTMTGPGTADMSFSGGLEGNPVLIYNTSGSESWCIGSLLTLSDELHLKQGNVTISEGLYLTNKIVTTEATQVTFGKVTPSFGLKLDVWYNNDQKWSTAGHSEAFEAMRTAISMRDPNLTTDMQAFGDSFYSGANDAAGGGPSGVFAKIFGSTKNNFAARFTGYFTAEKTGTYAFRVYADDSAEMTFDGTNTIIRNTSGGASNYSERSVYLASGAHPISVLFCEEGSYEVLQVWMKAPDETTFVKLPTRLLRTDLDGIKLGKLTGKGVLTLEENGVWPEELDLSDFSGGIVSSERTASSDVGCVTMASGSICFNSAWALSGTNWTLNGKAVRTAVDTVPSVFLVPGIASCYGSLNSASRIPLDRPWTLSFDYQAVPPYGDSVGDGFSLVLHDSGASGNNSGFSNGTNTVRIGNATAYGMQLYLMPNNSEFTWIKNRYVYTNAANVIKVTAAPFTMNGLKESPMRVTFAYDGNTNLSVTLVHDGVVWSSTNALAGADLAEKFPNGAYLGVWGQSGGYYTGMLVNNLSFDNGTSEDTPILNGVLGLSGGSICLNADNEADLSADFVVSGPASLAPAVQSHVKVTSDAWTFDLTNPKACLTLSGALLFDPEPISLTFTGDVPSSRRLLVDFSGVTSASRPIFRLADGVSSTIRLIESGDRVYVLATNGTLCIIR